MRRVTLYSADLALPTLAHIGGVTVLLMAFCTIAAVIFQDRSQYFIEEY
jgi:hypothetical protein